MPTIEELKKARLKKLKAVLSAGLSPFPSKTKRTHTIEQALRDFSKLEKSSKEIVLAGRIMAKREHGKAAFLHIKDGSLRQAQGKLSSPQAKTGRIQAYLTETNLGPSGYQFFLDNFDIGDFVEIKGTLFKTRTGEKTIKAVDYNMLAKALRPLPEKWHGLKDIEERYRQRYVDLLVNEEVREVFEKRAKIIKLLRGYLESHGFIEVKTPTLQPLYGGASAKPFITHHNALDIDLYLRISNELYLKRLIIGGLEKVFEIGTDFRNEGMDRWHNPEFTMLEFYWAYKDYKDLMDFTEKMLSEIIKKLTGSMVLEYAGQKVDFSLPWDKVSYIEALNKTTGINVEEYDTLPALKKVMEKKKIPVDLEGVIDLPTALDKIYKSVLRPEIKKPTFLIDHPYSMRPLAKRKEKDPTKVESFHLIIAGLELVNAYSELNDPTEQRARWEEELERGKKGAEEYHILDRDYIRALEYGMPPVAGWGMGIDRFVALLTNQESIRGVILFPTMRPK